MLSLNVTHSSSKSDNSGTTLYFSPANVEALQKDRENTYPGPQATMHIFVRDPAVAAQFELHKVYTLEFPDVEPLAVVPASSLSVAPEPPQNAGESDSDYQTRLVAWRAQHPNRTARTVSGPVPGLPRTQAEINEDNARAPLGGHPFTEQQRAAQQAAYSSNPVVTPPPVR
jgi:hypothetical protein